MAHNLQKRMNHMKWVISSSMLKTLAAVHKTSSEKMSKKHDAQSMELTLSIKW